MIEDTRPTWPYNIEMSLLEWFRNNRVYAITGTDWHDGTGVRSGNWMTFKATEESKKVRSGELRKLQDYIVFDWGTYNSTLIKLTHKGEVACTVCDVIKKWDKKHNAEIATYKRLATKYGALKGLGSLDDGA